MSFRLRIVIPSVAVFALAYGVTVAISINLATRRVERQLQEPARNLARMIGQFGWSSPEMLGRMKAAFGADIIVGSGGTAIATSLDNRDLASGLALALGAKPPGVTVRPAGHDAWVVAAEEFSSPQGSRQLILVYPVEQLTRAQEEAARPLLVIASIGLVAVLLLGFLIARTLARPIERLAAQTADIAEGRLERIEAVGKSPELSTLVGAFNRMLERLRIAQAEGVRSARLATVGQMAAGIAHEIRNPLSSMKMTVQMLLQEKTGADREPCELLLREIDRLDLVAGEFATAGRDLPLRTTTAGLAGIVDEVLELLSRQLDHLKIRVERSYGTAPPVRVDPVRIKRAVMNLVLNGAQAMPQGGMLGISIAPEGAQVRLTIRDGGPGIPEELRPRLFEPFVTGKPDGIGLGLMLTKKIVEDHGGAIGFDSSPQGTTFRVDLPA